MNLERRHSGIWEEDIPIADIEELEIWDTSEIFPRRLNVADGSAKLPGRDYEFQEPTLRRESTVRRENPSGESHCDREEFQLEETKDNAEAREDFWSFQGDSFIVIILNREFNFSCREKNHFLFH